MRSELQHDMIREYLPYQALHHTTPVIRKMTMLLVAGTAT